ncbi:lanC-like protein GCL1 [Elaeis guineensis]|uniref:LanC-like protein GCL1 n=1 Tax=Elaeis guineensis var. tenera TaxID=51953 RepID=A0A6I9S5A2_ELAGV|nr:lanC-like protein GCL1 [Elaeis guineensis]
MSSPTVSEMEHDEAVLRRMESLHVAVDLLPSSEAFLKAAISLKDQVLEATWKGSGGGRCIDPTAYVGLLGTAITCLRAYEVTGSPADLRLAAEIVDTCTAAARSYRRRVTFLCGRAGVYVLGAVAANYGEDTQRRKLFLDLFLEVAQERALPIGPEEGGLGMPYELLHGRAGFLYAALFINKHLGPGSIPAELLDPVVEAVLAGGRAGASDNPDCPLMYRWHGTRFWGAAHGLAGILHVLLHFRLNGSDREDVRKTVRYMVQNRFGHSGNYPSSEGNPRDKLVQWSHGAGGVAIMLCKAAQVFPDEREFRDAAIEAGEVVWKRGSNQKVGLADGIAGNAYAFLSLYQLTKEKVYLERAEAFAGSLYHNAFKLVARDQVNGGENTYSLFQGLAGVACLWFDLMTPESASFPGFEL